MTKECVIKDGKIINIGEWNEQRDSIEISPAEYDEDGNIIKEAVYVEQVMNPFPDGATIEEREFEYDPDRGWYEVGTSPEPTAEEKLRSDIDFIAIMADIDLEV